MRVGLKDERRKMKGEVIIRMMLMCNAIVVILYDRKDQHGF